MANRFTGKTPLAGLRPLTLDGRPVQDQFATYRDLLARLAGPAAAALFAEPIATWREPGDESGSISWYADAPGEPEALASLPADRRAPVEQALRGVLASLQPALADPRLGPWLRRALVLASPAGVLAVGNAVVLTQWGLARHEPASEAELASLAAAALCAYLPAPAPPPPAAMAPPPVPSAVPAAAMAASAVPPAPPRAAAALSAAPPPPPAPPPRRPRAGGGDGSAWNWWLLPAGALVALVFLSLGLWQGSRVVAARFAGRPSQVDLLDEPATRAAIDRQKEQNAALEREIETRRRLLGGDVCQLDPAQVPRIGPDRAATVPPAAVPPPPPGAAAFSGTLADLLKQAVVLIIYPNDDGVGFGSGFFITPELVVTNRHVIEHADPTKLLVINEKVGRLTQVEIVTQSDSSAIGGTDVAVLRVHGAPAVQPLSMTTTVAPLDQVIAAGYPALLMRADAQFEKLLHGDVSAIPQVILTDGRINAIQPSPSGIKIMPHSAAVSGGNSGGPLVDGCGRVVGINTFITANQEQVVHANYAQKSDEVIAFIRDHGVAPTVATGPCTPGAPATPPAPTAQAPDAAPGAPPRPSPAATAPATPPAAR